MGVVVGGRYPELGQKVAIKFLRPEHAANAIVSARFLREAQVAAKVKSGHFVRVYDLGRIDDGGIPYLVMEMLHGRDLADELAARGPLPIEDAIDFLLQAMVGIAEVHALGIVHRDLKPSNLFLAEVAGTRLVKVLDFGISKETPKADGASPLTSTDNVLGTPQYMSPEQVRTSKDVDARSDIWALGVILYELLTQKLPFVPDTPDSGVGEIFAKVLYFDPEKPRAVRADLPEELEGVILKCLTRDRAARFANVAELAEALRPFAAATSLHRIDAIKSALDTSHPELEIEGESEALERVSQRPTAESTPAAKQPKANGSTPAKNTAALAPTTPASERMIAAVKLPEKTSEPAVAVDKPNTAMTSSSIATQREPEKKTGRTIGIAAGAVVLIGVAVFAIASTRGPSPAPATASTSVALPSITTESLPPAVASDAPSAMPVPAAEPSAASASAAIPAITTVAKPVATARVATTAAKPKTTASAPPAKTTAPAAAPTDILLDRK